ncbi:hypothetical protein K523DRAFT_358856 [Schizophyllum commune Tattone D]|nr:hypothetical protein K523DRAFT_358856 [Schizophyllum commune Tattone D]
MAVDDSYSTARTAIRAHFGARYEFSQNVTSPPRLSLMYVLPLALDDAGGFGRSFGR